jgi:hypothetical protein
MRHSVAAEKLDDPTIEGNVYTEFSKFIDCLFETQISAASAGPAEQFGTNRGLLESALELENGFSCPQPVREDFEWASIPPILLESTDSSDVEYPDTVSSAADASTEEDSMYEWESMAPTSEMSDDSSEREEWNDSTSSESNSDFDVSSTQSEDVSDSEDSHNSKPTEPIRERAIVELDIPIDGNFFNESSDIRELYDEYHHQEEHNITDDWRYRRNNDSSDGECNMSLRSDQTEWSSQQSSNPNSEFEDSDSGDEHSDVSSRAGERLDNLMSAKVKGASYKPQRDKEGLRIYDTLSEPPTQIFHYSQPRAHNLYSSPPVFHPSQPLLVWALGGGEIMFIDFSSKTYFSRRLNRSSRRACYISIKFYFSSCGRFLHICALEARKNDAFERHKPEVKDLPAQDMPLRLLMQVSTHRLSVRKTARCAPHLIFRKQVDLGAANSIPISRLPYTLTWTNEWLYITHNDPNQDQNA